VNLREIAYFVGFLFVLFIIYLFARELLATAAITPMDVA
jgi:hypothetical protein